MNLSAVKHLFAQNVIYLVYILVVWTCKNGHFHILTFAQKFESKNVKVRFGKFPQQLAAIFPQYLIQVRPTLLPWKLCHKFLIFCLIQEIFVIR